MGDLIYVASEKRTFSYIKFMLANSCMPTLLGVKPSCIITVNKKYIGVVEDFYRALDCELQLFSCMFEMIFEDEITFTLFIYQPVMLKRTLEKKENSKILLHYGYDFKADELENTVHRLKLRYEEYKRKRSEFPHELGVLLGYPVDDVIDYIKYNGKNYKSCGFWKVYHNVEQAEKVFAFFRLVREDAMRILRSGKELMEIKASYLDIVEYAMVG